MCTRGKGRLRKRKRGKLYFDLPHAKKRKASFLKNQWREERVGLYACRPIREKKEGNGANPKKGESLSLVSWLEGEKKI